MSRFRYGLDGDRYVRTMDTRRGSGCRQGAAILRTIPLRRYSGVDVLGQDVSHMPGSANACFCFCFPPPQMIAVVLQNMQGCKARAVVVVPDDRQSWFPLLAVATVRSVPVAAKGGAGTFFRMYHQKGRVSFVFRQRGMRAVEVDFRQK